MEATTFQSNL